MNETTAPSMVVASGNAIAPCRASCDCGRLQIGDVTREEEFLCNDLTNPNTNPKTLSTRAANDYPCTRLTDRW